MKKYLQQLLTDIDNATQNVPNPYCDEYSEEEIFNWIMDREIWRMTTMKMIVGGENKIIE